MKVIARRCLQKQDALAFWVRGVPLASHYPHCDYPIDPAVFFEGSLDAFAKASRIYTDGSGGTSSADPRTRRCGWAAVVLDESLHISAAIYGRLAGHQQSVPRAELMAVTKSLDFNSSNELDFVVDAAYIVRGTQRSVRETLRAKHDDLWKQWLDAVKTRAKRPSIIKVKSHLEDKDVLAGKISKVDLEGNKGADFYSGEGAKAIALHEGDLARYAWADARVWCIQRRIISCYKLFFKLCPREEHPCNQAQASVHLPKSNIQTLQWAASHAGHELHRNGNLWRCLHCNRCAGGTSLRKLASEPCDVIARHLHGRRNPSPPRSGSRKAFWRPSRDLVLKHTLKRQLLSGSADDKAFNGLLGSGRARIHGSHSLAAAKGVVWCWKCGSYAVRIPRLLAEPCRASKNKYTEKVLKRLRAGLTPLPRMQSWPSPESTVAGQLHMTN